jgi:aminoglycoside phosphotransferase (APT) family kinase protein
LHRHLRDCADLAVDPSGPLGVAHGDFTPSQVLFDGPTSSLVDFDTVCLAEPALDLGQFTAHLAAAGPDRPGTTGDGAEDLADEFLREYLRLSGSRDDDVLLARVAAYRTMALTRLAVSRWRRLEPQRVRSVLALLDQPQRVRTG